MIKFKVVKNLFKIYYIKGKYGVFIVVIFLDKNDNVIVLYILYNKFM